MNWIASAVLYLALLPALSLSLLPAAAAGPLAHGDLAPNWVLMNPAGEAVSLYQIVDGGTPAVMVFCASWCERCKSFLPQIKAAVDGSQAQLLMLNVWENGDPHTLANDSTPQFALLLQAEAVAKRFEIDLTPGVVVVDRQRRIAYKPAPTTDVDALARELKRVLAGL